VRWDDGDRGEAIVNSVEELDSLLDRVQDASTESRPPIVDVEVHDYGTIRIGLAHERSVLSVLDSSLDPPYFNSVGKDEDGPDLIFDYRGHWTEFSARCGVDPNQAREAVRRFVSGERLPSNITWEET
jgi:Immunity protein Imm1